MKGVDNNINFKEASQDQFGCSGRVKNFSRPTSHKKPQQRANEII